MANRRQEDYTSHYPLDLLESRVRLSQVHHPLRAKTHRLLKANATILQWCFNSQYGRTIFLYSLPRNLPMAVCELCGKEAPLVPAVVEGSQMEVCLPCGKFGKVLRKPVQAAAKKVSAPVKETVETIMADYAAKIRHAREKNRMTQAEFA